jgi:hypothetical protein
MSATLTTSPLISSLHLPTATSSAAATATLVSLSALPSNVTLTFVPVAASYVLPWWSSLVGGVVSFCIAVHNFYTVFHTHASSQKNKVTQDRWVGRALSNRHVFVSVFGLVFTFLQSIFGLLHLLIDHENLDRIQGPVGGAFITIFASLGTIVNPTIRLHSLLVAFACINTLLALLHFCLLAFLPTVATAKLWLLSSNACITEVDLNQADNTGEYTFGFFGSSSGSCYSPGTSSNLFVGNSPDRFIAGILGYIFLVFMAVLFIWAVVRQVQRHKSFKYTALGKEDAPAPPPQMYELWFTLPILIFVMGCAAFTWEMNRNQTKPLQLQVTLCPTIAASSTATLSSTTLGQCVKLALTQSLPNPIQAIKDSGVGIAFRFISNI